MTKQNLVIRITISPPYLTNIFLPSLTYTPFAIGLASLTSECASEVFFNNIISISQEGKNVSAVIENGKGIIQFMDEEGINWHLVE